MLDDASPYEFDLIQRRIPFQVSKMANHNNQPKEGLIFHTSVINTLNSRPVLSKLQMQKNYHRETSINRSNNNFNVPLRLEKSDGESPSQNGGEKFRIP